MRFRLPGCKIERQVHNLSPGPAPGNLAQSHRRGSPIEQRLLQNLLHIDSLLTGASVTAIDPKVAPGHETAAISQEEQDRPSASAPWLQFAYSRRDAI